MYLRLTYTTERQDRLRLKSVTADKKNNRNLTVGPTITQFLLLTKSFMVKPDLATSWEKVTHSATASARSIYELERVSSGG